MTPSGPAKPSLTSFLEALRTSGGLRFEHEIRLHEADAAAGQPALTEVLLSGADTPLLLERNGELLHAIESLAAAILRLEPDQAEQLSFDADGFKAARSAAIMQAAQAAIAIVQSTGKPFLFSPMNSRERRLLHLALVPSGLATASSGLGPRRFVVLYPAGQTPEPERFETPVRRPGTFRNQGGYKQRTGSGRGHPRPAVVAADERISAPAPRHSEEQDPESHGNRADINGGSQADEASTKDRLDSIRLAFRKR